MKLTLPNMLTLFRIIAIPLVVVVFFLPVPWARPAAGVLFALAGITDFLDGYLARRLGQTSNFGAFLDPVADKLIVATALVLLVQAEPPPTSPVSSILSSPSRSLAVVAAIIIGREITVSALREWMSEIGARTAVAVGFVGKWKTTVQIVGISLMLFELPLLGVPTYALGMALLLIAAGLTVLSMIDYLRAAWPILLDRE